MRIHFVDSQRGVLMILGVVLHAANVYGLEGGWEVHDSAGHPFFDGLASGIHAFRMPAFFVIAGYFCRISYVRHGVSSFWQERTTRLLVPFVVTLFSLNVLQLWIQEGGRPGLLWGRQAFLWHGFWIDLHDGRAVQHLWFLLVLLVFCLAMCVKLPRRARRQVLDTTEQRSVPQMAFLLCAISIAIAMMGKIVGRVFPDYHLPIAGLIIPEQLAEYFPFFLFGVYLGKSPERLRNFSRFRWYSLPALLGVIILSQLVGDIPVEQFAVAADTVLFCLLSWGSCQLCFSVFQWACDRPSAWGRYAADASYSVYLFHHLLVVVLALLLLDLTWPAGVKFAIVCFVTLTATCLLHELLVRRSSLMSLLLNGRPLRRKRQTQSQLNGKVSTAEAPVRVTSVV